MGLTAQRRTLPPAKEIPEMMDFERLEEPQDRPDGPGKELHAESA